MKTATILALALILALLAGCTAADALKGTWAGTGDDELKATFVFNGKGGVIFTDEMFFDHAPGTYAIKDSSVDITVEGWDTVRSYTFAIDGDKLTLVPPEDKPYIGFELTKKQ